MPTRSLPDEPSGVPPRVELVPLATSRYSGPDAVELGASYGLLADDWQAQVLTGALGEDEDRWAASRVGLLVPRQNGKNGILEIRELAGLILFGEQLIIHTAHLLPTALEAFRRIRSFFDNYDDLRKRVKRVSQVNGAEGIELLTGQRLLFKARSKSAGRGFSGDCLIFDEAQELSDETYGAALPTLSARPNPQVWLTGTPPGPTTNGEVFERTRKNGLAGTDPRLYWAEWSCEPGVDLDDKANWQRANPALGIRIRESAIANERSAMSDEEFARERLAVWEGSSSPAVVDAKTWQGLADPSSGTVGRVAYGIDVNPDRSRASIGMSAWQPNGKRLLEWVETRNSADWVVEVARKITEAQRPICFVVDAGSPAGSYIQALKNARVPLVTVGAREYANACGTFFDEVYGSQLSHLDQPPLNSALAAARKRKIGTEGAWAWHRVNAQADITPLVACTLALHGLSSKRRNDVVAASRKVVVLT